MRISVTVEDIERGRRDDYLDCPISRAVKRATGTKLCKTYTKTMILRGNTYLLPMEARCFVWAFDRGEDVEPFEFELEMEAL